jgi:hypothetical protein
VGRLPDNAGSTFRLILCGPALNCEQELFDKGGRGALSLACMPWLVQMFIHRGYSDIEKDHLFPSARHIIVGEFIEEPRTQGIIEGETFLVPSPFC